MKIFTYLMPLLIAWSFMIIVTESSRTYFGENGRTKGLVTVFSQEPKQTHCSWACGFNTTDHCLVNHSGLPKTTRDSLKPFYFGVIHVLQSTGGYRAANIVFLVILWPLILSIMIVKVFCNHRRIKQLS